MQGKKRSCRGEVPAQCCLLLGTWPSYPAHVCMTAYDKLATWMVCGNIWFIAIWSEAQFTTWTCDGNLRRGQSCGNESCGNKSLTWGIWCYHKVNSVRIDLNCRIPSWYQRTAWWYGKPSPTTHRCWNWVQTQYWSFTWESCLGCNHLVHSRKWGVLLSFCCWCGPGPRLVCWTSLEMGSSTVWQEIHVNDTRIDIGN